MSGLQVATTIGADTVLNEATLQGFKAGLSGELLRSSDGDYDDARKVWNGMIDKRPALIARCAETDDVVQCVRFAREHDLLVSVRGGGHNYAGNLVCDDGLVTDLSPMKGIRVDPDRRIAKAEAGLKLGEFDSETQKFGLATTLGVNTDTGIAGLTLGGGSGFGWRANMGWPATTCSRLSLSCRRRSDRQATSSCPRRRTPRR